MNLPNYCYGTSLNFESYPFFGKLRLAFWEQSSPAYFGPFLVQICLILAQNQHLSLYLPNGSSNFVDIWYRNYSDSFLWSLKSGKILPRPFWAVFGPNIDLFWVQHIFEACDWLGTWYEYSKCIHFLWAKWNSFVMNLFISFQLREQMWEVM